MARKNFKKLMKGKKNTTKKKKRNQNLTKMIKLKIKKKENHFNAQLFL